MTAIEFRQAIEDLVEQMRGQVFTPTEAGRLIFEIRARTNHQAKEQE